MWPNHFRAYSGGTGISILSLLLMGVFPLVARQSSGEFNLETKWNFTLRGNPLNFNLAVCPDGTVYAMHDRELQIIGSDGHLIASDRESSISTFRTPIACDDQKRLIVAGSALSILKLDQDGKPTQISSVPLKVAVSRVLEAPDGAVYAITAGVHPALILISPSGKEVLLKEHKHLDSYTIPLAGSFPGSAECALAWDTSRQRLAFALPGQGKIEFFQGQESDSRRNTNPPSTGPDPYACALLPLTNVVSLPNGRFARTRIYQSEIADALSKVYIEILDGSLALVGQPVPANGLGLLIGSSDDGSLYFVAPHDSRDNSLTLTKRFLAEESPATTN